VSATFSLQNPSITIAYNRGDSQELADYPDHHVILSEKEGVIDADYRIIRNRYCVICLVTNGSAFSVL